MRRKISTTVYLNPGQLEDMKALAERLRRPTAGLIREALDEYLDKRRLQLPPRDPPEGQGSLDYDPPTV